MSVATVTQPQWSNSDRILKSMAAIQTQTQTQTRKGSTTMELDKSQPPTPDGTGLPANFYQLAPDLYRSSYPAYAHYQSLRDLHLKTIITLVPQELPLEYSNFLSTEGIIHRQIPILANKDAEIYSDEKTIHEVLNLILEPKNYPLLIHCNKGRHRTGCMIACFRKVLGWSLDACIDEYVRFASPKERELDKKFIERFNPDSLKTIAYARGFIGGPYKQPKGLSELSNMSSVYTNYTSGTYTSNEDDNPNHQYQELARREHRESIEAIQRWTSY